MPKQKLFLLPGWAVNSSVWYSVSERLSQTFDLHFYDFPGYGTRQESCGELGLEPLVLDAIDRSPKNAIWLGWSLGSIVAMEAARKSPQHIAALALVCPTPKFISGDDWEHGQTEDAIANLAQRFESNYETALKRFLLLQAGTDASARTNAKATLAEIIQHAPPTWATLNSGLEVLRHTDLRSTSAQIAIPTGIIVGRDDRVIPPQSGTGLHQQIPGSTLVELPTGHSPFIERPDEFSNAICDIADSARSRNQ